MNSPPNAPRAQIRFSPHLFGGLLALLSVFVLLLTMLAAVEGLPTAVSVAMASTLLISPVWLPLLLAHRNRRIEVVGNEVRIVNWRGRTRKILPVSDIFSFVAEGERPFAAGSSSFIVLGGESNEVLWRCSASYYDSAALAPFAAALGLHLTGTPSARTFSLLPHVGPRTHRLGAAEYVAFLMKFLLLIAACAFVGLAAIDLVSRLPGGFNSSSGPSEGNGLAPLAGTIAAAAAVFAPLGLSRSSLGQRHFLGPLQGMPPAVAGALVILLFIGMWGGFLAGASLTARL